MLKLVMVVFLLLFLFSSTSAQTPVASVTSNKADSLYYAQDWERARAAYQQALAKEAGTSLAWSRLGYCEYKLGKYDESLAHYERSAGMNPSAPLQPVLYSRMARVLALKSEPDKMYAALDKATAAGYSNYEDLDTLADFAGFRQAEPFKKMRDKIYGNAFPCSADPKAREFDFWVGEWDVYQTGTRVLVGKSSVQVASGGCMILENWTAVGAPHNGKSMNFIDRATSKWEQVWVGSEGSGHQLFINGEYRDSAMRFEFEKTNAQGKKTVGRFIFFNQGPDQVRQFNETSSDEGKTWTTVYDFTYIRKKA